MTTGPDSIESCSLGPLSAFPPNSPAALDRFRRDRQQRCRLGLAVALPASSRGTPSRTVPTNIISTTTPSKRRWPVRTVDAVSMPSVSGA